MNGGIADRRAIGVSQRVQFYKKPPITHTGVIEGLRV